MRLDLADRWGRQWSRLSGSARVEVRWSPEDPALVAHTPRVHWHDWGQDTAHHPCPPARGTTLRASRTLTAYIELPEPAGSSGCSLNSASILYMVCCTSPSPICPSIHQSPICPSVHPAESRGRTWSSGRGGQPPRAAARSLTLCWPWDPPHCAGPHAR